MPITRRQFRHNFAFVFLSNSPAEFLIYVGNQFTYNIVLSQAIYNCNGNVYKVGISRDIMYGAAGTSNDWSYEVAGIPFCYLLELRSKQHKFKVPQCEIAETGTEVLSSLYALMEFVDTYVPPKIGSTDFDSDNDGNDEEREGKRPTSSSSASRRY